MTTRETREANRGKRWARQEATKPDGPHGWIQWKGTNVCIDLHCPCGRHSHVDGDFFYHFRCACGQLYDVAGHVHLVPVPKDEEDDGSHPSTTHADPDSDPVDELTAEAEALGMYPPPEEP